MCASHRITAQRSRFFWPWQQSGEHVLLCNEHRERKKREQRTECLNAKVCVGLSEDQWLLGLMNYIVMTLPSRSEYSCAPVFNNVMLPSADICVSNTQTQILTHDVTVACCFGVSKVNLWEGLCHTLCLQYTKLSTSS